MTTKEAIQAMLDGKKVKMPNWYKKQYIYFDEDFFRDEENNQIDLNTPIVTGKQIGRAHV